MCDFQIDYRFFNSKSSTIKTEKIWKWNVTLNGDIFPLRKKASFSAASVQLRSYRKALQKLRKSGRYWHLRKSLLLCRAAEKPAFTKLLRNSAEKLQKSQLFYSFYKAFMQSFVKIVMMSKAAETQQLRRYQYRRPFCEAIACSFYADLRKSCISTAFTRVCVKAAFLQLLRRPPAFLHLLRRSV